MPGRAGTFAKVFCVLWGICPTCIPGAAAPAPDNADSRQVVISNPLAIARPAAVIDVPVAAAVGKKTPGWSASVRGHMVPAQYLPASGVVRFVTALAGHETLKISLIPKALPAGVRRVQAVLNVQQGGHVKNGVVQGGVFRRLQAYTVPESHFLHDGLIAFEGIGWESDKVAYRLYLDHRNVTDLFGKFGPGMVFQKVGQGFDDYQYPRAWGGDIFKVGNSLGVGGLGFLRGGQVTQTGPARISAKVLANGPVTAIAGVNADSVGGGPGFLHARYSISAGSTLSFVSARRGGLSRLLITGLTRHTADHLLRDPLSADASGWHYLALWGPQEHGADPVGTVVFYRQAEVKGPPVFGNHTLYVRFKPAIPVHYAFAGRWSQEGKTLSAGGAVKSPAAFQIWLEETRKKLNSPVIVHPAAP